MVVHGRIEHISCYDPAWDASIQQWMCTWCNDLFGDDDDDVPPVCIMCRKAGRT